MLNPNSIDAFVPDTTANSFTDGKLRFEVPRFRAGCFGFILAIQAGPEAKAGAFCRTTQIWQAANWLSKVLSLLVIKGLPRHDRSGMENSWLQHR